MLAQISQLLAQDPYMRLTAADALRHPFIRQDDSSLPSPRIIIDQVSCTFAYTDVVVTAVCSFCRTMLCISAAYAVMRCLSVRLSRSWIMSKRINISSKFFHHRVATPFLFFHTKRGGDIPTATPLTGASNAGGV